MGKFLCILFAHIIATNYTIPVLVTYVLCCVKAGENTCILLGYN